MQQKRARRRAADGPGKHGRIGKPDGGAAEFFYPQNVRDWTEDAVNEYDLEKKVKRIYVCEPAGEEPVTEEELRRLSGKDA